MPSSGRELDLRSPAELAGNARANDAGRPWPPRTSGPELHHTAASLAIKAGANVKVGQQMLGHASAAMTQDVYARPLRRQPGRGRGPSRPGLRGALRGPVGDYRPELERDLVRLSPPTCLGLVRWRRRWDLGWGRSLARTYATGGLWTVHLAIPYEHAPARIRPVRHHLVLHLRHARPEQVECFPSRTGSQVARHQHA